MAARTPTQTEEKSSKQTRAKNVTKTGNKSLFSISNGHSLSSQLDDAALVLRRLYVTTRSSASPSAFARRYLLSPIFKNDLFVIGFGLPALSKTPRVLEAAPSVRSDTSDWTYQGTRTAVRRKRMMNVASYNYLGFVDLEYDTRKALQHIIRHKPFSDDGHGSNASLEKEMKSELKSFVGFSSCALTSTGYSINLVAFPAMAVYALVQSIGTSKSPVFLMDSESHSSMFMGAFIACADGRSSITKFKHNDMAHLEENLLLIQSKQIDDGHHGSLDNVWVTVEGIYSMNATTTPLLSLVALKRKYGFRLYIDEAHSFLAIGHSGRGIVEYFQDLNLPGSTSVSMSDIDMIGGTLSKSLASVGGFVLSHEPLREYIESRVTEMQKSGSGSLPTLCIARTLQILKKPHLIAQRVANLQLISAYVAATLEAKGYKILLTKGGPLIAVVLDTVDRVLSFLKVGRDIGLICCGAAYPAAPRGAPRIRLSLTGAHTLADADALLQLIDQCSILTGVKGLKVPTISVTNCLLKERLLNSSTSSTSVAEYDPAIQSDETDASILTLCEPTTEPKNEESRAVREMGVKALEQYGLGAAGPRWMFGSFDAHLSLEDWLNKTIMNVIPSSIPKNKRVPTKTSLFTEARLGIMSVIATAMEGLTPRRAKAGEKHLILLPNCGGLEIQEAAAAAQKSSTVKILWYDAQVDGKNSPISLLEGEAFPIKKMHITIFLDTQLLMSEGGDLEAELSTVLSPLSTLLSSKPSTQPPQSLTILLSDPHFVPSCLSSTTKAFSILNSLFPSLLLTTPSSQTKHPKTQTRFLLFSAFASLPYVLNLQGAFCTGSKHLVEKVQFLGQGVMYTAMMPPVNAVLVEESLRRWVGGREERGMEVEVARKKGGLEVGAVEITM